MPGFDLPLILGPQGLIPMLPADVRNQLIVNVTADVPDYTANLPPSLVTDVNSTVVGAILLCNQAQVGAVNSLAPIGANEFLLMLLGAQLGVPYGLSTNTSVNVQFVNSTPGYVVSNGFLIKDTAGNVYQIQGGGIIGADGTSLVMTALGVQPGPWNVPANTVTGLVTSVPNPIVLNVNNAVAGTPAGTPESMYSYRQRVLQANLAASVGTSRYIKTLLGQVPGVLAGLVSVQQANGGGLRCCIPGGDVYQVAYALFKSGCDPSDFVGSAVNTNRNVSVTILDPPDQYTVIYVNPPVQTVLANGTWNTSASNFTGGAAFPQLTQGPEAAYINQLAVGQPINELEMNAIFQAATSPQLDTNALIRLVWSITINNVVTAPNSGTGAVYGDPESYFATIPSFVTITQG